ncbi:MAG: hypothetical protein JEY96_13210 [Bacteroidales bacterium]|nr:hypothetical protein [Bacteroidales bacterium]
MRKILYLLIIVSIFVNSCSDDDLTVLSNRIALKELTIENSQIKLEWNRPYIQNFDSYRIIRTTEPITNFENYYYYESIAKITDIDETVFYDNLTLKEDVFYTVVATSSATNALVSNSQKLDNTGKVIFEDRPNDVVFYPEGNKLFMFYRSKIYLVDYETMEISDSIVLSPDEHYGTLGNFNNKDELYVSCSNGSIRIFDIKTLTEIATISVGGNIKSVVCDDFNNLYLKTYGRIYSYSRSTLNFIDGYSGVFSYNGTIKHLKNSNRIIEITSNISPDNLIYYDHDNSGNFTSADDDNYHGDHPLNHEIFECFPEGNYFITDKVGAIYNQYLDYVTQIGDWYYNEFENFFVDNYIYAIKAEEKEIELYSKTSFSYVKTYTTTFYPVFVFKDNSELIIIGSDYYESNYYYGNAKYTIEKINLN